jgi:hypothetical protein
LAGQLYTTAIATSPLPASFVRLVRSLDEERGNRLSTVLLEVGAKPVNGETYDSVARNALSVLLFKFELEAVYPQDLVAEMSWECRSTMRSPGKANLGASRGRLRAALGLSSLL